MIADSSLVNYVYESDSYGGPHNPNIGVLHAVESPLKRGFARSLIGPNWFGGPAPTSTHYNVDPGEICQGVPENRIAWHCGTGNPRSIAVEQAGYARFTRPEWNTPDGVAQRTNIARLMADINVRRPLIRLKWLSDEELRYAFNNPGTPGGWATHDQMRRVIGGTTHYDPMNAPNATTAYPLAELMSQAISIRNGTTPDQPQKDWDEMATKDEIRAVVAEEIARQVTPKIINDVVANVLRAPEFALSRDLITQSILTQFRFKYENQPADGEGTNNVVESINATNGEVYRSSAKLDQILDAVTAPKS